MKANICRIALTTSFLLGAALLGSAAAQSQLWIVDDDGGAGVDFTNLQAAIDAASDGDTIEVREGFYSSGNFAVPAAEIDGKSLVLTAPEGYAATDVFVAGIAVCNLASSQSVVLRGLYENIGTFSFSNSAGPILAEDLSTSFIGIIIGQAPALTITNCASVTLVRCAIKGISSFGSPAAFPALQSSGSSVTTYECTFSGNGPFSSFAFAVKGAAGVCLEDGFLFDSGSTFTGGDGSSDASGAGGVGAGGPGLRLGLGGPVAQLLGTSLVGGPGGDGGTLSGDGPPGPPSEVLSGSLRFLSGPARHYALASPVLGGGSAVVDYAGQPADFVYTAYSLAQNPLQLLPYGVLVPDFPITLLVHGLADGQGLLQASIPVPGIPPGYALNIYFQGVAFASNGTPALASPSFVTIVP